MLAVTTVIKNIITLKIIMKVVNEYFDIFITYLSLASINNLRGCFRNHVEEISKISRFIVLRKFFMVNKVLKLYK